MNYCSELNCRSLLHIPKAALWIRTTVNFLTVPCLRSFTKRTSGYHLGTFGTVQFFLSCNKHGVSHYNLHFLLLLIPNSHSFLWIYCLKRQISYQAHSVRFKIRRVDTESTVYQDCDIHYVRGYASAPNSALLTLPPWMARLDKYSVITCTADVCTICGWQMCLQWLIWK